MVFVLEWGILQGNTAVELLQVSFPAGPCSNHCCGARALVTPMHCWLPVVFMFCVVRSCMASVMYLLYLLSVDVCTCHQNGCGRSKVMLHTTGVDHEHVTAFTRWKPALSQGNCSIIQPVSCLLDAYCGLNEALTAVMCIEPCCNCILFRRISFAW